MMRDLDLMLSIIWDEVVAAEPSRTALLAARYLMAEFDRELLPDWVALLAGGNLEAWEEVIEETKAELIAEDCYD